MNFIFKIMFFAFASSALTLDAMQFGDQALPDAQELPKVTRRDSTAICKDCFLDATKALSGACCFATSLCFGFYIFSQCAAPGEYYGNLNSLICSDESGLTCFVCATTSCVYTVYELCKLMVHSIEGINSLGREAREKLEQQLAAKMAVDLENQLKHEHAE